jgi:hypothetical protein
MPLFLSSAVAFDFRGEGDQMARLKTLPVSPTRLAWAEVAGSALVTLLFQALLLLALLLFGGLSPVHALLALVAYVPVTVGLLGAANLAHLLAPKAPFWTFLLQTAFLVLTGAVHLAVAWLLGRVGLRGAALLPPLFGVQLAATGATVALLGRAFARHDVGTSA